MVRGFTWGLLMLAALTLGTASTVHAKLYRYTDKSGNLHVVDNPRKVPPMYQDQLAPEDRPDPVTGTVQSSGDADSRLPALGSIQTSNDAPADVPAKADANPANNARETLREKNRDSCEIEIQRLKEKKATLDARYQAWASVERNRGVLSDSGPWVSCSSGDARACIENRKKLDKEKESALLESSPFQSDYRTLEAKARQLERRCRD